MSNSEGSIEPFRLRELLDPSVRQEFWKIGTAICTLILVAVIPVDWVASAQGAGVGGSGIAEDAINIGPLIGSAVFMGLFLLTASRTPWRAGFGAQLPRRLPVASLIQAVVIVVMTQAAVWLGAALLWPVQVPSELSTTKTFHGFSVGVLVGTSAYAGLWEETLDIAVPAGLMYLVLVAVNWVRRRAGRTAVRPALVRGLCISATAVGLITRFCDHLYQGVHPAAAAVVWGAGMIAIFAIYRSVIPLIVGHFLYDFIVVGVLPITVTALVGAGVVALVILAATIVLPRVSRTAAAN